jgi:hypothetical protein
MLATSEGKVSFLPRSLPGNCLIRACVKQALSSLTFPPEQASSAPAPPKQPWLPGCGLLP